MAIKSKKIKLSFDGGVVDGKQKKINKTYGNINLGAEDSKLKGACQLIVGLQSHQVLEMLKIEESTL